MLQVQKAQGAFSMGPLQRGKSLPFSRDNSIYIFIRYTNMTKSF